MKTTPKKVVKKTIPKKVVVVKTAATTPVIKSKDYKVELIFDGKTVTDTTNNVAEYIRSLGLKYIKTNLIIRVTYQGKTIERVLNRQMALRSFRNNIAAMSLGKAFNLAFDVR